MIGKLVGGLVAIYILLNAARNQYLNEIAVIYREDARLGQLGLTNKPMVEINGKRVHGRFLHITDLHPDPYYVVGSSPSEQCHSGSKSDEVKAGKYGDAILGCDSPMLLMNKTIEWISDNLADKIDFIVWTGDNIRHDNDQFKISNLVLDEEEDEQVEVEDNNSNYFASFGEYQIKKNFETQGGVPNNKVGYMESLRRDLYAKVKGKKKSGAHLERYSIAHVGSSIVPTFNPGFRIWEYNISDVSKFNQPFSWDSFFMKIDHLIENLEVDDDFEISKKKKKHKKKKPDKTFPPQFPKHNKLGPAYTPQFLSPEKYVQYYLDLESVNKGDKHFEYEIEYKSNEDPFYLPDLTVSLWLQLARNLGKPTKSKFKDDKELKKLESIWKYFLKFSFVSSDYENKNYG
ncbi:hypothetical protein QCA50_015838 [Cerrena zonata]|uniref:Calcineurin-like phosphoesterase domain-containing protein n=1 Tax=Cerrena zonata TaxID=2478898 RepID=A0AAW0FNY3_9APHY